MDTLTTIAAFDDLRRCEAILTDGGSEIEFLRFAQMQEQNRLQWLNMVHEAQRLQRELDASLQNVAGLETKLYHARRLLEAETKCRKEVEKKCEQADLKMLQVRDLLYTENINEQTRDKFAVLTAGQQKFRLSKKHAERYGNELNSTGSFLSDLSVTQSEDDLLDVPAALPNRWRKHRPSAEADAGNSFIGTKRSRISTDGTTKRQSNIKQNHTEVDIGPHEKIVASTRVSIPQGNGPITAESVIEAVPKHNFDPRCTPTKSAQQQQHYNNVQNTPSASVMREVNYTKVVPDLPYNYLAATGRLHKFVQRTFLKTDTCHHCQKKIRFGTAHLKCSECRVCVHVDCKEQFKLACIPQSGGTPTRKGEPVDIAHFAPTSSPMVPGIIVHCINEIEGRGLNEVGIYRVSGSEKDIKALKERFLRGKAIPSLTNIDVHVLCGCIKDFLRNSCKPLITKGLWKNFADAAEQESLLDLKANIIQLPTANRDTLAFLMQHFLRIANATEVKMPASNIAKIFGPTIVGYSSDQPGDNEMLTETLTQATVMEKLLSIPADYWNQYLNMESVKYMEPVRDCGLTPTGQYFGTPSFRNTTRKGKYYATPPYTTIRKK